MIRRNKLWDDLSIGGDSASLKRQCTANDLYVFAHASGNLNPPLHLPMTNMTTTRRLRRRCGWGGRYSVR